MLSEQCRKAYDLIILTAIEGGGGGWGVRIIMEDTQIIVMHTSTGLP
jgi:hypothetical protein